VSRTLPERTVEAWATAYVTRWFPTAHLWAPTQNDPYAWDVSGALPNGLHFVLEYKGVEGDRGPYVPINRSQLDAYIRLNERIGGSLAWYLLPAWTHSGQPGRVLPAEANVRVLRTGDPRPQWRAGIRAPDPSTMPPTDPPERTEAAIARGCETYFYVVEPTRIEASGAIRSFGFRRPGIRAGDVPKVAEGLTLEHFIMLVNRGLFGIPWPQLLPSVEDSRGELGELTALRRGAAATFYAVVPEAKAQW
jgi:hypothetical protein